MPAKRLIMVGHAALDRVYRIEAFPPEPTKVRAIEAIEIGGGMAANAAVTAARLGARVELWSRVGDDAPGTTIKAGLKAERVDTRYVQMFEDARSSTSAIIVDDRGERLIVGMRDTSMPSTTSLLPLERVAEADAVMADLRWLEAARAVLNEARRAGVPTILDAELGAREALPELLALADYAIFSSPALKDLVRGKDEQDALDEVLAYGANHAGVTLGSRGYLWRNKDGDSGLVPGFSVDAVDTTGAGDAFHGAFTLFLAQQRPVQECARRAAAVAAIKCTRLGSRAGLPTLAGLEDFLARHDTPKG
ncbi:MAG: PfkB family carbohydrate kinase [Hyphomicrobiaceae bacterium]